MNFFDLHCDTAYKMFVNNQPYYKNSLAVSGEKGEIFDNWCQTFAVWLPENTENPFDFYKAVLKNLKRQLNGNVTPYFAVEGGSVLENNAENLYILKQDGIRFLTLTWNNANSIAGGVLSDASLTDFGKTVIRIMNELSMGVDLSHLNDKSFFKVIELAEKPLATHSNCRSVFGAPRNLTDEQIKLICEKGGIIGLNFYPAFLGNNFYKAIYENIYHLCDMGYENHIAIGSDFDGADMCDDMENITRIPELYSVLRSFGLNNRLLDKIFYKNALEFVLNL